MVRISRKILFFGERLLLISLNSLLELFKKGNYSHIYFVVYDTLSGVKSKPLWQEPISTLFMNHYLPS